MSFRKWSIDSDREWDRAPSESLAQDYDYEVHHQKYVTLPSLLFRASHESMEEESFTLNINHYQFDNWQNKMSCVLKKIRKD